MSRQDAIAKAAELAYENDTYQVVGQDQSGQWVIRHIEDPESDQLDDAVKVGADGEQQ